MHNSGEVEIEKTGGYGKRKRGKKYKGEEEEGRNVGRRSYQKVDGKSRKKGKNGGGGSKARRKRHRKQREKKNFKRKACQRRRVRKRKRKRKRRFLK